MEHTFETNFFTMLELLDSSSRLEIEGAMTKVSIPAHEIIYEQGNPGNAVYIVASGLVEVVTQSPDGRNTRSIDFMVRGDFFGEIAVLTGHPRLATVHARENSSLLQMEKLKFIRLLDKVPRMGAYFSRVIAHRLHKTSTEAHLNIYSLDLTGNLQHFDLLTIFQAITSMGRSGELHLHNSAYDIIGSFFFRKGRAEHARFAHLLGLEAIWQGFVQSATDGTFSFHIMDEPSATFSAAHKINLESTDLLMQGVTKRDAYESIPEPLRHMEARLGRLSAMLAWSDSETLSIAQSIWKLIAKRPQPLDTLWRRLDYSVATVLEVANILIITGQAELLPPIPAEQQRP